MFNYCLITKNFNFWVLEQPYLLLFLLLLIHFLLLFLLFLFLFLLLLLPLIFFLLFFLFLLLSSSSSSSSRQTKDNFSLPALIYDHTSASMQSLFVTPLPPTKPSAKTTHSRTSPIIFIVKNNNNNSNYDAILLYFLHLS